MDPVTTLLFKKPFALVFGPPRAGSGWVEAFLRARPDVCLPEGLQDLYFFDRLYDRGIDFYAGQFSPGPAHRLMAEVATTVFDHDLAPRRVYDTFNDNGVRLLCLLRHPVRQSYSLYRHFLAYGLVRGTLREACFHMPSIIGSSFYARHLGRWMEVFGRNRVHLLFQEQLEQSPERYADALCLALGIEPHRPGKSLLRASPNVAAPQGGWPLFRGPVLDDDAHSMTGDDAHWLNEQLAGQVEALKDLLGIDDFPFWNAAPGSTS
jgi:hypothetical protein